ncbi:hypothetical protein [Archangium sp.]|uniref:hypothetical protein n=1 Tax=Archangium sp. TaxID=1872627 RepID=UPI00286B9052|nr:hypothetical protein [Archangium sp.]
MAKPLLAQILFSLVFLGIIGLLLYVSWRALRQRQRAWATFAERYGLTLHSTGVMSLPHVTGSYEGQQLDLKVEQRGSGKNRSYVTVLHLDVINAVSQALSLEREGLGDKLLKLFGRKDEEIGDDDFDRHFDLKNLDPESATLLRQREVQRHLFTVAKTYHHFDIRQGLLSVEKRTVPMSPEALESFVQPAIALAQALTSPNQDSSRRRATS